MAGPIASGSNFSTLSEEGISLITCYTVNLQSGGLGMPEYPAMPFTFGTRTIGLDGSTWIFCEPASNYAIGTVGYTDVNWKFTATTTSNTTSLSGQLIGVMSQVASTTVTPTSTLYDGVWVQFSGLCPAIQCAASTAANAQLYTTTTAGQLSGTSGGSNALNGIVLTTAIGSGGAATGPGVLNFPEIILTT